MIAASTGLVSCPAACRYAVLAHGGLQPLPHFVGLPGLQADRLRPLAGGEDLGLKIEPLVRQRAQRVGQLQIDEVLRRLGGVQLRLGPRAPAVGLGAQVLDLVDGSLGAQKGRHVGGQIAAAASLLIMRWPSFPHAWAVCEQKQEASAAAAKGTTGKAKRGV